jgi:nitrite reductase (NO-forming)
MSVSGSVLAFARAGATILGPPRSLVVRVMMMFAAVLFSAMALTNPALAQSHDHSAASTQVAQASQTPAAEPAAAATPAAAGHGTSYHAPLVFTLRTGIAGGRMVYIGVGGTIDGLINPELTVYEGELVQINLINGEGAEHDIFVDQYNARSNVR